MKTLDICFFRLIEFCSRTNKCEILVDVGACRGTFSFFGSKCGLDVISVEPDPINFSLLRRLFKNKQNSEIYNLACGSNNSISQFYHSDACGKHSMKEGFLEAYERNITHTSEINVITLDDIIDNSNFKDANIFLKIDVEGAELDVLRGASELLKSGRVQILYCETQGKSSPFSDHVRQVTKLAHSFGYELISDDFLSAQYEHKNLVFSKTEIPSEVTDVYGDLSFIPSRTARMIRFLKWLGSGQFNLLHPWFVKYAPKAIT